MKLQSSLVTKTLISLFPQKPIREYSRQELGIALLGVVAVGTITVALLTAPGLGVVFKAFEARERRERQRIYRRMKRLERSGFLRRIGVAYAVTAKGRKFLAEEIVWRLVPKNTTPLRNSWFMVLFDVPLKKSRTRNLLRVRLRALDCVPYQGSVFVHCLDLRSVLEPFCEYYGIRECVNFLVVSHIEGEAELRRNFKRYFARR